MDLNLLHPLQALLEEQHMTRAAKRCLLSQPAMSRALDRLREMFGDVLLVRSGRGYERTVRGESILRDMESLMPRLEAMIRGEQFDPARSGERFRGAMTDHASMLPMPSLMERIRTSAANIKVETSIWDDRGDEDIAAGRTDTALCAEAAPSALQAEVLYEEDFVCLVGSAQHAGSRRFTLKQYLDLPHAVVDTLKGQQTLVDRPLAQFGLKRRVALSIPFFVPTIFAIARTDLVLTLPRRLAKMTASMAAVSMVEPPHEVTGFPYFMASAA